MSRAESNMFYFSIYQVSQYSRKYNDDNMSRESHDQERLRISGGPCTPLYAVCVNAPKTYFKQSPELQVLLIRQICNSMDNPVQ
jgi:hypothetical protein